VAHAAKGLVQLFEDDPSMLFFAPDALPGLAAALRVAAAAPAAARALELLDKSAFSVSLENTPGMLAALTTALVHFDDAVAPVLGPGGLLHVTTRKRMQWQAPGALARIVRALSSPDTAEGAAWTLGGISGSTLSAAQRIANTEGALPALVAALSSSVEAIVFCAANTLADIAEAIQAAGAATTHIVAALAQAAAHPNFNKPKDVRVCLVSMRLDRAAAVAALEFAARSGAEQIAELRASLRLRPELPRWHWRLQ